MEVSVFPGISVESAESSLAGPMRTLGCRFPGCLLRDLIYPKVTIIEETILFTIDPCYGNLSFMP